MTRVLTSQVQPRVLRTLVCDRAASSSCKDEGGRTGTCILPVAAKDFIDTLIVLIW